MPVQELLREVGPAEVLEVHREERDVVEDVHPAQLLVEVEAVDDAGPVGQAEHVVGGQVTVTVDREPGAPPAPTAASGGRPRSPTPAPGPDRGRRGRSTRRRSVRSRRGCPASGVARPSGPPHSAISGLRAAVAWKLAIRRATARRSAVTSTPAATRVLNRAAAGSRRMTTTGSERVGPGGGELADPEIDVGGQPSIQLHLPPAGHGPDPPLAEVEEAEVHRLLHLVGAVADQDHHRAVRLHDRRRLTGRRAGAALRGGSRGPTLGRDGG